ncbi:MAG: hypothetical protein ABI781_08800 [Burkholderiales bacterium]
MRYLSFDFSDAAEGPTTIEAIASTSAAEHAAVMDEVRQVLNWAWRHFAHTHGAIDDGADWDHDLQLTVEGGRWHAVALTLTASAAFAEAFVAEFGEPHAD